MTMFRKATKTQSKLRMALYGVSGSGKTYSALAIASGLGRVAVIDTERGSASKYAGRFEFDVLDMQPPYSPARYVEAIRAAEAEGYDVLVIDSLTHAWSGSGGALEMVDNAAKRSTSNNSYVAWRDVTPQHNMLIDAMIQSRCHIVATMRSKTEYVMETRNGKQVPVKKAMAPIQRDGMEYEFDIVAEMTAENEMIVQKSRMESLSGAVVAKPGAPVAELIRGWLSDGAPEPTRAPDPVVAAAAAQNGGVVRLAGDANPIIAQREQAVEAWKSTAAEAKLLGLTNALDANRARTADTIDDLTRKTAALRQAINDALNESMTPAAGEQAPLIPQSPLEAMPA